MDKLIRFLTENPILLLILVAWIAGMIGNIGKAAKQARERAERAERAERTRREPTATQQQAETQAPQPRVRPVEPGERTAEEVAREMRRILGLEPEEQKPAPPAPPPPSPRPVTRSSPLRPSPGFEPMETEPAETEPLAGSLGSRPVGSRPVPVGQEAGRREFHVERPPTPVVPTTQERRLVSHVDPHVGERIARRTVHGGLVGKPDPGVSLGTLGGRVSGPVRARRRSLRYSVDDVQKALVLNEILGKPLALRELDDRLV